MNKYYTSLEQSRHLADIGISFTTADMTYEKVVFAGSYLGIPEDMQYRISHTPFMLYSGVGVPVWTIEALTEIIPTFDNYVLRIEKGYTNNDKCVAYKVSYIKEHIDDEDEEIYHTSSYYLIDGLYEMILLLKNQNLL